MIEAARRRLWNRDWTAALEGIQRAAGQLSDDEEHVEERPQILGVRAELLHQMADLHRSQGDHGTAIRTLRSAVSAYRSAIDAGNHRLDLRSGSAGANALLAELLAFSGDLAGADAASRASRAGFDDLGSERDDDWTYHRDSAVGWLVSAEIRALRGNSSDTLIDVERGQSALALSRERLGTLGPRRHHGNLLMNMSRAEVLRAAAFAGHDEPGEALRAVGRATAASIDAARLTGRSNPCIERRLGIAYRVGLELDEGFRTARRRGTWFDRGERAFLGSTRLSPGEPDTLFEHARLLGLRVQELGRARERAAPVTRAYRDILRRAVRAAPRHPILRLFPEFRPVPGPTRGRSPIAPHGWWRLLPLC